MVGRFTRRTRAATDLQDRDEADARFGAYVDGLASVLAMPIGSNRFMITSWG
jgi:hypothetical protein